MSTKGEEDTALADVTNNMGAANIQDKSAAVDRVREAQWVQPEKFNYESYNADSREKREAVANVQEMPAWASNAVRYEWQDDFGEVGPKFKELEEMLFGDDSKTRKGEQFDKLTSLTVTIESDKKIEPVSKFEDAGLHPVMLDNVKLSGYPIPTPIQAYVLPCILKNQDVIGVAQTGSGKTAAYLIPTLSKLMGKAKKLAAPRPNVASGEPYEPVRAEPLILIVAPTRELATQIFDESRRLCYRTMLRPCVIYGGAPTREQRDELGKGCDVLIATPGRLQDFMQRGAVLSLRRVRYTVIDEADEMVTDDWAEEMNAIMGGGDANTDDDHVYMMFSATFPKEARALARRYMAKDHVRIRVGRIGSTHANVMQRIIYVDESKKRECLFDLLLSMPPARTMIFVNNKKAADFLDDFLYNRSLPSTSIHSDRTQREREDAIRAFKAAKAPILVCTGVSARGLDIRNVMHVINYDLPTTDHGGINEYVHRIGRTARIGNVGLATSFYNDRNEDLAEALTKVLVESKQEIPDFLEQYKPADGDALEFNDDTDNEGEDAGGAGGNDTWGAGANDANGGNDAWGSGANDANGATAGENNNAAWGADNSGWN